MEGKKSRTYRISSPISRAIFQCSTQKFGKFFHKKRDSAYSRGFGIKKKNRVLGNGKQITQNTVSK